MPLAAIAMAGELRTLGSALPNVNAALLQPLRADLFMDVALESTCSLVTARAGVDQYRCGSMRRTHRAFVDEAQWAAILRALQPVHVNIAGGEPGNATSHYGLFSRWVRLLFAIEARESRVGSRYRWVVRTRPDLIYTCSMSRPLLSHARGRALLKYDLLAVLPRAAASIALSMGSRDVNCHCKRQVEQCVPSALHANGHSFSSALGRIVNVDPFLPSHCYQRRTEDDLCFAPRLVAVILRNGTMTSVTGVADGRSLPTCSAEYFVPPAATSLMNFDTRKCRAWPKARRWDFGRWRSGGG